MSLPPLGKYHLAEGESTQRTFCWLRIDRQGQTANNHDAEKDRPQVAGGLRPSGRPTVHAMKKGTTVLLKMLASGVVLLCANACSTPGAKHGVANPASTGNAGTGAAGTSGSSATVYPDVSVPTANPNAMPPMPGVWRDITPRQITKANSPCTDIQFALSNPSTLIAMYGNDGGGLFKSTDSGSTWAPVGNLPTPLSLGRVLIDPQDPLHMYATGSVQGNSKGFWVSHDGGNSWAMPPAFSAGAKTTWSIDVYNVVADPADFNHFLLTFHYEWPCCPRAAGVVESFDGGTSYVAHNPVAGMDTGQGIAFLYNPALHLGDPKTWLMGAGYNNGLFRTSNAGATWTQVSTMQENHGGFDAHYSAQGFLHVGGFMGVYRSTDNGLTWTQESLPPGAYYSVIGDGMQLYTARAFVGVDFNQPFYVTPEGASTEGDQWTPFGQQSIPSGAWKMSFDPVNRIIYNAAWGSGCWALTVAR